MQLIAEGASVMPGNALSKSEAFVRARLPSRVARVVGTAIRSGRRLPAACVSSRMQLC